jgi:hypothetical protein
MSGGGKSSTSTSSVSIPPEVLARYNAVNTRAETVAQTPFTPYGGQFVAPLTGTQQAGIANVSQAAGMAQPYYQGASTALLGGAAQAQPYYQGATQSLYGGQAAAAPFQAAAAQNIAGAQAGAQPYQALATGYGLAGARQVAPGGLNVGAYMSPYTEAVAQPTYQALRQQQQQEQQKIIGDQIRSGAFGGDRGKIAQANLAQQQNLATAQALGNIYQQGYGQALGAAQQQQGVSLQAEQANRQAQQQAAQQFLGIGQQGFGQGMTAAQQQAALGQQLYGQGAQTAQQAAALGQGLYGIGAGVSQGLAGLGTGAQQAALQGGQAQLAAGTVEQQTQQAQNQALYNQFLQQQGYPFQVAQFLANIAMGTGALSGSTTTTTQPSSFFSDERLKEDVEPIGKTFDGQQIVRFKYKGEPGTRIGLVAQDVEKRHPEAVGLAGGYKTVDYDKATDEAAARAPHKAYGGGLSPWEGGSMGGSVFREDAGAGFAAGGAPGDDILAQINQLVNAHQGMYPYGKTGLYGASSGKSGPYGSSLMQSQPRQLMMASPHRLPEPQGVKFLENVGRVGSAVETGSKGASFLGRQASLSPEYQAQGPSPSGAPISEPRTAADYLDLARRRALSSSPEPSSNLPLPSDPNAAYGLMPATAAHGGAIRSGLAAGGLPYSQAEDEYVPEDISKPIQTPKLQTASTGPMKDQGAEDAKMAMDIAKLAMMAAASDRRLKDNIEPIGKLFDGQKVYRYNLKGDDEKRIGLMAQEVEKRYPDAVGLAPRHGYQAGGEPTVPEEWRSHISEASRRFGVPEHILTAVARQESQFGRAAPDNPMQIIESTARNPGFGLSPIALEDRARPEAFIPFSAQYIAARNPNVNWEDRPAAARALAATYNAGGDPNYAYNVGRYIPGMSAEDLAALRVNTQNQGLGGAEPQPQSGGLGQARPESVPILQGLGARREPEKKDFMQRNQDWIVPLLTGLGTMASSPSRYLGSAILQGIGGGALQYAGMQERGEGQAIQREQVDVSRLREINQAMQTQEQMRQRLLESFGPRLEGNQYLNPYSGELVSAQQRMAIVNSMMSNMARQMGLPAMTGAEAAGGLPPGQRPGEAPQQPPSGAPAPPSGAAPGAAGSSGLVTPATGAERPAPPDASVVGAGRSPDYSTAFTVDTSSLRGQNNPDTLEQEANALFNQSRVVMGQGLASNAQLYQEQAKEKLARADAIRNGTLPVRDVNGQLFRGFAQASRDRTRFEEEQKKVEEAYAAHASEGVRVQNTLEGMARTYQSGAELGAASNPLAMAAGLVQTALGPQNTPEAMNRFLQAVQTSNKEAIMLAFNNLRNTGMSRGTNMALQEMLAMVPGPEMTSSARYSILTRAMGEIARDNAFYEAAMQRDPRESIGAFQARWNSQPENSLDRFTQNVRSRTVGFTGMTPNDVRQLGAASAAVPPNLQGRQGLEYDRTTGIFRAPSGQDAEGRPVFEYFNIAGRPSQAPGRP